MKRAKAGHVDHVRVITDSRDGSKDYWVSKVDAEQAYAAGRLAFDLTNHCYTVAAGR